VLITENKLFFSSQDICEYRILFLRRITGDNHNRRDKQNTVE